MVENASRAWSKHAADNNITVKTAGTVGKNSYAKQSEQFLLTNYPQIEKKYNFTVAQPFVKNLRTMNVYSTFFDTLGERALFLDPRLQGVNGVAANWSCMRNMHKGLGRA